MNSETEQNNTKTDVALAGQVERCVSRKWWEFWKKNKKAKYDLYIEPGQLWILMSYIKDDSPWPIEKKGCPVTILDVKDGWVRYGFGGTGIFSDERMKLKTFTSIYTKLPANEKR